MSNLCMFPGRSVRVLIEAPWQKSIWLSHSVKTSEQTAGVRWTRGVRSAEQLKGNCVCTATRAGESICEEEVFHLWWLGSVALQCLTFTLHLPNQIRNAQIRMYKNKWQLQKINYGVSYVMSSNFISSECYREKTW